MSQDGTRPILSAYHSINEEMAGITKQVHELLQKNIDPPKIGIICPPDLYTEQLEQYFKSQKIPFYSSRKINILSLPFIKKTIQLMRYINAELESPFSGDELLFEILHFDFYKIPSVEIVPLAIEVNSKKYGNSPTAIRKLLKEKSYAPPKDLFDSGINKNLKELSAILEKLIADASFLSTQQLYENIIRQALIIDYAEQSKEREWLMQTLNALSDFIKTETTHNPRLQLNELTGALALLIKEGEPLLISRINGIENPVQFIQPGELKEQNFAYLFIAGANAPEPEENLWYNCISKITGTITSPFPGYNPESVVDALLQPGPSVPGPQLFISFSKYDNQGKELAPASLVNKLLSGHAISVNQVVLTADELKQLAGINNARMRPEIAQSGQEFIKPMVQKFIMNVSALNSYLNCPLGFYYKNIIRIPDSKNEAMEFGSAVHYALEKLFKKMSGNFLPLPAIVGQSGRNDKFPPVSEMVEDFAWYMNNRRVNFTREAFERRIQYGEEILRNYYDHYINSWNKVVSVERNMRGISVNGVPLKGKLDKLEFDGKDVNIVDYKTGDIERALLKMKPPGEQDPNGGDYWRQAVFYKILVDNYEQKDWRVKSVEFDFIEPDKEQVFRKEKILINDPDIETVKQQFTRVWNKIQAFDFYTGCGKPNCHWCNFAKDNGLAVTMHQQPEETAAQ